MLLLNSTRLTRNFSRIFGKSKLSSRLSTLASKTDLSNTPITPKLPKKSNRSSNDSLDPTELAILNETSVDDFAKSLHLSQNEKLKKLLEVDTFHNNSKFPEIEAIKNKDRQQFLKEELIDDSYNENFNKLVRRPGKETIWGLGGQLLLKKENFFKKDRMPDVDEIMYYLEMELMKDILKFDMSDSGRTHVPKWVILGTGLSSRHIFRCGKNIKTSLEDIDIDW